MGINCFVKKITYLTLKINNNVIIDFTNFLIKNSVLFFIGNPNDNINLLSFLYLNKNEPDYNNICENLQSSYYDTDTHNECNIIYNKYINIYNVYLDNIITKKNIETPLDKNFYDLIYDNDSNIYITILLDIKQYGCYSTYEIFDTNILNNTLKIINFLNLSFDNITLKEFYFDTWE